MHGKEEEKGCNEALLQCFLASTCNETPSGPYDADYNVETLVSDQKFKYINPIKEGHAMICLLLDLFHVCPNKRSPFADCFHH